MPVLRTGALAIAIVLGGLDGDAYGGTWKFVAAGRDCGNADVGCTAGTFIPDSTQCGAHSPAQSAVCWDGTTFGNVDQCSSAPGTIWCTYKTTPADDCVGGGSPGFLYECVEDTVPAPAMSPTGMAAAVVALVSLAMFRMKHRSGLGER